MKAVLSYVKRLATWLRQGYHVSIGPLIAVVPPLLVAWLWPAELGFRIGGFFLQVLGVYVVWVGIRGTRDQFEVPESWAQTKAWVLSFPRLRGCTIHASVGTSLGSATLSARANVWSGVPDDATIEQRLEALEKKVRRVRDDLSGHEKEAYDRARSHDKVLKRERSEREVADGAIHEKIREIETGGLKLNAAGVWWLASGTICSTFPGELSRLFGGS